MCTTRTIRPAAQIALTEAGIRHVDLGRSKRWELHRMRILVGLLRAQRFDVLHAHKFGSNFWGVMIGRACGVPVVIAHEHSWSFEGEPLRAWLDGNVIGRLATCFVAVSNADKQRMVELEGIESDKVVVMPTAYIPAPAAAGGDLRGELGLAADTPLIASAAMLRPEKRVDLLLEAHARVLSIFGEAHLAIAGDGQSRPELERRAAELGSSARVHFLGARTDVDAILRAADVAALASDREGSPLLVFECMANDTPLVATAVGGVPDVVDDGQTGILVARRDPEALAAALVGLLGDPPRRAAIAAAARERLPQFTIDATAARFADLYESLVAQRASAAGG